MNKVSKFLYALFFTRDDDLDILQILFSTIVIVAIIIAWKVNTATQMSDAVRIEGMVTLRWMIGLLVVTAVPKWLAPLVAQKTTIPEQLTPPSESSS